LNKGFFPFVCFVIFVVNAFRVSLEKNVRVAPLAAVNESSR